MESDLIPAAVPMLIQNEGQRLHVYDDIFGIPTIGVGFNLGRPDAPSLCAQCGANYGALVSGAADLTSEQSEFLLQQCIKETIGWLTVIFPAFWTYSQPRQLALLDMGFNLGETKFRGFKQMISCILAGDWQNSAGDSLLSAWATEVGQRATNDAEMMRAG